MSICYYQDNELYLEQVALASIADRFGTPSYVYSETAITSKWQALQEACHGLNVKICYAVKANSNHTILKRLKQLGASFDIVSQGELERVLAAGASGQDCVFSGVGKQIRELDFAIANSVFCIDIESKPELERLIQLAKTKTNPVSIALRINPNIDSGTHPYIATGLSANKFGIEKALLPELLALIKSAPQLQLRGIACHIGSQIIDLAPFKEAMQQMKALYETITAAGFHLEHINLGGGLGICYQNENPPSLVDYVNAIRTSLASLPITILLEPGRSLIGEAGILLTRVEYIKPTSDKCFAIVDAGMNDLIRPALYQAEHAFLPIHKRPGAKETYTIVGPVCESADTFTDTFSGKLLANDLLAIDTVGAYGFCMSSNYNSRGRAAEILVRQNKMHLIRRRETTADLLAAEINLTA